MKWAFVILFCFLVHCDIKAYDNSDRSAIFSLEKISCLNSSMASFTVSKSSGAVMTSKLPPSSRTSSAPASSAISISVSSSDHPTRAGDDGSTALIGGARVSKDDWRIAAYGQVDQLNAISIGGYQLGFWFAQQGSIYVFVALIFYYAKKMGDLDREFGVDED